MAEETATNPVEGSDTSAPDTAPDTQEVEAETQPDPQYDDDGNLIEPAEEDEEVDLGDDLKLKVPKTAAQRLKELQEGSLRQADYTRKTQDLAEQRKAFETERQAIAQATNEELNAFAQAKSVEPRLQEYARLTPAQWDQWEAEDYEGAQRGFREFTLLKDQHAQAMGALQHHRQQRTLAAQQDIAKRSEEGRAVLAREIGWNDNLKSELIDYAKSHGFSASDVDDMEADPRIARILHEGFEGRKARQQTQQAQRHITAQTVKPAAKAGGGTPPPQGLDDRLGPDEWMKRRAAQVRKRA